MAPGAKGGRAGGWGVAAGGLVSLRVLCPYAPGGTAPPASGEPKKGSSRTLSLALPRPEVPAFPLVCSPPLIRSGERGQALFRLCICPPHRRSQAQPVGHWGVGNSDMVSWCHDLESP